VEGSFLDARIAYTKTLIEKIEAAVDALTVQGVLSYSLDTGQTRQSVTKNDIVRLNEMLNGLYNRLATLEARKSGSAVVTVTPSW
jgi:hypothetical protein